MAHEEMQASVEAGVFRATSERPQSVCKMPASGYVLSLRGMARAFRIILLAGGMLPAFFSDTPEGITRMKEINSMR